MRRSLTTIMVLGLLLSLVACSDDGGDPATQPPAYDLTSASGVGDALRTLLAERDTSMVAEVFAPEATLVFAAEEATREGWPASFTDAELALSLRNLLGGAVAPEVAQIEVQAWTTMETFAPADEASPYPGSLEADYVVSLLVICPGHSRLRTQGVLRLSVGIDDGVYRLVGIQELLTLDGNTSLGAMLVRYLGNRPPVADLDGPTAGETETPCGFDASLSCDPDLSDALTYSWDLGERNWTPWSSATARGYSFEMPGTHVVRVRVRDRWGLVSADSVTCEVVPAQYVYPSTPDRLLANFWAALTDMDLAMYRDTILMPDYRFVLTPETVEEFALPDNLYHFADEVAAAEHMFSGQPNAAGRVLADVELAHCALQTGWLPVPDDDPYFGGTESAYMCRYNLQLYFYTNGSFRYEVAGDQIFYVARYHEGMPGLVTPRYRLLGQVDQTGNGFPARTEATSWGGLKVLWR